jgi:hypothetical protein
MATQVKEPATKVAKNHGWFGTETVRTRFGSFDFKNSFPAGPAASQLRNSLVFIRAVEAYMVHMPPVSWLHVWRGVIEAGAGKPNQILVWESLMDSATLLLTGNTETVYGLASLDLKRDGPVVIEVPASMLGAITDLWQNSIADIGPTGVDKGQGGKFLVLPPDQQDVRDKGYVVVKSPTFCASLGVRGFQVDGNTEPAVNLIKTAKIYPLSAAADPPPTAFVDASHQPVDTLFADDSRFYDDLAWIVDREPEDRFTDQDRFQLAAIGIERGKPFQPDAERRKLLEEAAQFAEAIARTNSFASQDDARLVYPDRRWEWAFVGGSARFDSQGYTNSDRRAGFAYLAIGMSPAMVEKHVGAGSQYLFTPRDVKGEFLDGGKDYRLHLPADIPVKNFWSIVAYDADSRSLLRNDQQFPSVSTYTGPVSNDDDSIDVYFGPSAPAGKEKNWIQTRSGKGWFVLFRFYGPLEPFFNQTWKPDDIVPI